MKKEQNLENEVLVKVTNLTFKQVKDTYLCVCCQKLIKDTHFGVCRPLLLL